ncbi:MAG: DUF7009 family protein [Bryobacteraceae bacterium]
MKLRLFDGAVRLRLSRSEIARLAENGRVEDAVTFGPGQRLEYAIESAPVPEITADFQNGRISVTAPAAAVKDWIDTDRIGIEARKILIEKDFQCVHPAGENDMDGFPNPLAIPNS